MFIWALFVIILINFIAQRLCFEDLISAENLKNLFNTILENTFKCCA
jgi:hypothetical protein